MPADPFLTTGLLVSVIAGCSALGGCIAHLKRRSPLEGVLLGLLLGPIGVLIECRHPYLQRPMVDKNAWDSLQSMMTYQQQDFREDSRKPTRPKRSRRPERPN